jgi:hypothetical protein
MSSKERRGPTITKEILSKRWGSIGIRKYRERMPRRAVELRGVAFSDTRSVTRRRCDGGGNDDAGSWKRRLLRTNVEVPRPYTLVV